MGNWKTKPTQFKIFHLATKSKNSGEIYGVPKPNTTKTRHGFQHFIKNITPTHIAKNYKITKCTFEKVLNKVQNGKAPGPDLIVGFWYKHMTFYQQHMIKILNNVYESSEQLPIWLTKATPKLLAKNTDTHFAKNYRPIALLNIMFKIYTGCLNVFIQDHCETNQIRVYKV